VERAWIEDILPRRQGALTLAERLRYPETDAAALIALAPELAEARAEILEEAIQDHRYAPYVARQQSEIDRLRSDEAVPLPTWLDYCTVPGLSNEMVERLSTVRPATLGAASRIRGVTPAALAAILVHARRKAA
jgi:tRNA uridine 5-carboxymethylaminomethyl modification enzyme